MRSASPGSTCNYGGAGLLVAPVARVIRQGDLVAYGAFLRVILPTSRADFFGVTTDYGALVLVGLDLGLGRE